eukprot:m.52564 g.52564  ORF g.52564 m.52564 type:complete len:600 (+) comp6701_c0_seq4:116-1915(+)
MADVSVPQLEREFEGAANALLTTLRPLEGPNGRAIAAAKQHLQTLHTAFAHAVDKLGESQRRLLRAQAVEVNSQQDLLVTRAECDRLGTALSDHMAAADAVAENAARNGVSEDLVADLTAKLQGLRDFLDDAEQSRREIERLQQLNLKLSDTIASLEVEVSAAERESAALKTELIGRIQQIQFLSKGMAVMDNPAYIKLLAGLEQNCMKGTAHRMLSPSKAPSTEASPARPGRQQRFYRREVTLTRGPTGFGFKLQGGINEKDSTDGQPVTIVEVFAGQPAARSGRLFETDIVQSINGQSLQGLTHAQIVDIVRTAPPTVTFAVLSRRSATGKSNTATPVPSPQRQAPRSPATPRNIRAMEHVNISPGESDFEASPPPAAAPPPSANEPADMPESSPLQPHRPPRSLFHELVPDGEKDQSQHREAAPGGIEEHVAEQTNPLQGNSSPSPVPAPSPLFDGELPPLSPRRRPSRTPSAEPSVPSSPIPESVQANEREAASASAPAATATPAAPSAIGTVVNSWDIAPTSPGAVVNSWNVSRSSSRDSIGSGTSSSVHSRDARRARNPVAQGGHSSWSGMSVSVASIQDGLAFQHQVYSPAK